MIKKLFFLVSISTIFLLSCKNSTESLLPSITGKAGEVVVVINDKEWDSDVRTILEKTLKKQYSALPQSEPIFDLVRIPHKAFSNIFKTHRNLIIIKTGSSYEKPAIVIKKNVWANPQLFINITAKNISELYDLIKNNSATIVEYLEETEKARIIKNYKKYEETKIRETLEKSYQIALNVPKGYRIDLDTNNFVWISHETPSISQGLFVYTYDYTDTSLFSLDSLIKKRDEILKMYVPGPTPNSYMTTEHDFTLSYNEFIKDSLYIAEVRGLWKLEGDFMGGPFISFSTADTKRNRIITVDGYVYAPKYDKRNYLRQIEGILHTLKIK